LVLLWFGNVLAAADDPHRILLVGNSFTFYNNGIHTHLRGMLRETEPGREPPFQLKSLTLSGGYLSEQAAGLKSALATWDWDVVVLQGHSLEAHDTDRVPGFLAAAETLSQAVRDDDAEPFLFMTWAYDGRPEMLPVIRRNYHLAAHTTDSRLIPVGEAFEQALKDIPGIQLYHADRKHPSPEGTYLAACTFYAALLGQSGAPLKYDAGLNPDLADSLCNAAWQAVQAQNENDAD
jgi:hypothetical protein